MEECHMMFEVYCCGGDRIAAVWSFLKEQDKRNNNQQDTQKTIHSRMGDVTCY
jgi:hypothetical protein